MNIGAGRIVWQDICTIDNAIADGSLAETDALVDHIQALKASGGVACWACEPRGPATQEHIAAVCRTISAAGVPVVVHAFTDGRDVPPQDAEQTFPEFLESLEFGSGKDSAPITVGSVTGRYWAMDRDNRWERVLTAYDVIVGGRGVAPDVDTPMKPWRLRGGRERRVRVADARRRLHGHARRGRLVHGQLSIGPRARS